MATQTETAYQYIKDKILDGTYKPSQKLTESQLAETIGVSRNTIKKALMMLEKENLVNVESNKGATIKSFTLEEIVDYLEIREVLEGLVAKSAAKNISDDDLHSLEEALQQMEKHLQNNEFTEYSKLNRKFHEYIYQSSKNVQAVELIRTIKTQLNRFHFRTILIPGRNKQSLKEHSLILNALKTRDEQKAEEAVRNHIQQVRESIVQNYNFLI